MKHAFPRLALGLLALWALPLAAAPIIYSLDPAGASIPLKGERISGTLPDGWQDDSAWARTWVTYKVQSAPEAAMGLTTDKIESGQCQIYHMLPDVKESGIFRVKLRARSPQSAKITIGPRDKGAPYAFQSYTQADLGPDYKDLEFLLPVHPNTQPMGFWIVLSDQAEVDIAKLEVSQPSIDELRKEKTAARYPDGEPGNLARISRFPLGLQSGWNLYRENSDGDQVKVGPDPKVLGPSAAPSLHIAAAPGVNMQVDSAPFDPPLKEAYVLSVYVKGAGHGSLTVLGDLKVLAKADYVANNEWRRVEVPFKADFNAKIHHLQIQGQGEIWVDALQVEAGEKATAYRAQRPCEVSLASASDLRIVFDDESPTVKAMISGPAEGGSLKVMVTSPYTSTMLAAMPLGKDQLQAKTFSFFQAAHPYGGFRVEAWVEDASGKKISSDNEIVVYRLHRPRYWKKDAPNSPFGTHIWSTYRAGLMAKATGSNWVRLHDSGSEYIGWAHLEPKKGEWHFRDKEIQRYRESNLEILGDLSTAPVWASYAQKLHDPYFDRYYEPKDLDAYANYCSIMAKRYKDSIAAWDVWNEPWGEFFMSIGYDETKSGVQGYQKSKDATGDYARMMATAYKAAKAGNSKATVLGFNTTDLEVGKSWTDGVAKAGGLKNCDVLAYHQYSNALAGYPGDALQKGKDIAIGALADKKGALPKDYWITEGSPLCGLPATGLYKHTLPFANTEDAFYNSDRLVRFVVRSLSLGAGKIFLYAAGADCYFGDPAECRALNTEEGYLDPSGAAHSAMAWLLEDTKIKQDAELVKGVQAYVFEGKGRAVAALCPAQGHASYAYPAAKGVSYSDLFGNPLKAGDTLGLNLVYASATGSSAALLKALSAR